LNQKLPILEVDFGVCRCFFY